ncbi:uncharacterized protein PHACADRAFT_189482 [Phanerochaete carnosa HHB-10118-sp]|uniref:ATP-dependent DNA helicase n=1 Tax=Phanerochaete carnosa (strain HHB-10118-sp) TaxID=650164 RepID=K5VBR9_PHACS|nr:uncharacterized protein PHACADRAFT_189482 [Phanerochaete carnosa HHB-10118-sp]EKM60351.1 hypothetical protein PHACADRAFT_189482 [Phanerochaete carnosa HHB-10118-sp]
MMFADDVDNGGDVQPMTNEDQPGTVEILPDIAEQSLAAVDPSELLADQRRAYNIIKWHVDQQLARHDNQLLMIIYGEGGTGKLKVIQTVTEYFKSRGIEDTLVKSAYTGIAASLIDGKKMHTVASTPLRTENLSDEARNKLTAAWLHRSWYIIDEISMNSCAMFAHVEQNVALAKG